MSKPVSQDPFDALTELQSRLAEDLEPVTPFRPARSSLLVALLGFVVGAGVVYMFLDLRPDASMLGSLWLWGPAVLSMTMGAGLIYLALRSLVPGHLPPSTLPAGAALGTLVVFCLLYWGAHMKSPMVTPAEHAFDIGFVCFIMELLLAIPMLLFLAFLARRGLTSTPIPPAAVGSLGVTLIADAIWRLFCQYSDPAHVALAHGSGMVTVLGLGMASAVLWDRKGRSRSRDLKG